MRLILAAVAAVALAMPASAQNFYGGIAGNGWFPTGQHAPPPATFYAPPLPGYVHYPEPGVSVPFPSRPPIHTQLPPPGLTGALR